MIPELGHFALILALFAALFQTLTPCLGGYFSRNLWHSFTWRFALAQLGLLSFCFGCLEYALLSNDFSVLYVAQNSSSELPAFYRFSALWGAHEGSILLWIFLLSFWSTLVVSIYKKQLPGKLLSYVLGILGFINAGLLLFLLSTSNPFRRLLPNFPTQGQELNPLLQDIGLAIHPPMLYLGYVGFGVVFAFALTGLLCNKLNKEWLSAMRTITALAFSFLTLGITLGSWWAYRELGWGGWWFWDPVENASFLPWLTGVALLHILILNEKQNTFKGWMVLLSICAFSLSLMGTFLVRSGILTSVHAFANDPGRGVFLLAFLVLVIGSSLCLYAWRLPTLGETAFSTTAMLKPVSSNTTTIFWLSREFLLLANNIMLMVAMATILLGTLYPLILDVLKLEKISVGAPYFNIVFAPIMLLVLFFMALVPSCDWKRITVTDIFQTLLAAILLGFGIFISLYQHHLSWSAILGASLAGWVIIATLKSLIGAIIKRHISLNLLGMCFAHIGLSVCALGIVLTSALSVERDVRMAPGDIATAGPYQFTFAGVYDLKGANFKGLQADFNVSRQGKPVATLTAEKRVYNLQNTGFTKAAILPGFWRDLYIALGDPLTEKLDGAWAVRLYYKPFVRWLWLGGLLMLVGGLCSAATGLRTKS